MAAAHAVGGVGGPISVLLAEFEDVVTSWQQIPTPVFEEQMQLLEQKSVKTASQAYDWWKFDALSFVENIESLAQSMAYFNQESIITINCSWLTEQILAGGPNGVQDFSKKMWRVVKAIQPCTILFNKVDGYTPYPEMVEEAIRCFERRVRDKFLDALSYVCVVEYGMIYEYDDESSDSDSDDSDSEDSDNADPENVDDSEEGDSEADEEEEFQDLLDLHTFVNYYDGICEKIIQECKKSGEVENSNESDESED